MGSIVIAVRTPPDPATPEILTAYWSTNDFSPLTTAMSIEAPTMIDGDKYTQHPTASYWATQEMFGFDLGSSQAIWGIECWINFISGSPVWWGSAAQYGRAGVYMSDDNVTYTLQGEYDHPTIFESVTSPPNAAPSAAWRIDFGGQVTARYWKVRCNTTGTGFAISIGQLQYPCEIGLYQP